MMTMMVNDIHKMITWRSYDDHVMILLLKVVGARPPPVVTWWRDGRQLRGNVTAHVRYKIFSKIEQI